MTEQAKTVLVTGGSGFLGGWCAAELLKRGHEVRTTVRDLGRESEVRAAVALQVDAGERLAVHAADLREDAGWAEAVAGCNHVLHVASPFPPVQPKDPDELIVPAREGTLRVLRAALDAGVERVVVTSSVAAIAGAAKPGGGPLTEEDWTDPDKPGLSPYVRSKTIAERAAWDFIAKEGNGLELAVINPVGVLGPLLGRDFSTSIVLVKRMLDGAMPGCPKLHFGIVDVRDVADHHIRAMTNPAARGERFLSVAGEFMRLIRVATTLRQGLGEAAKKAPSRELPNWVVRLAALRDSGVKQFVPELGKVRNASNEKSRRLLGWSPRSPEEAIFARGESLLRLGLVTI